MAPLWISQLSRDRRLSGDHCEVNDNAAVRLDKHDFAWEGQSGRQAIVSRLGQAVRESSQQIAGRRVGS